MTISTPSYAARKPAYKLSAIFLCAIAFIAIFTQRTEAIPAYPGVITAKQPDGTPIQFRIIGDENSHSILSLDGTPLEYDKDGRLIPAPQNTRGESIIPDKRKYLFSGSSFPSTGSPKALVILMYYPDRFFSMEDPYDYFNRMLNEEGYSENGATGSARDFFIYNSNGLFTPQFDVYGPIRTKHPMKYYGANNIYGEDQHPEEMVIEALTALDSEVDFSQYDNDGDGQIDNVYIYYAGYGENDSNVRNAIWPHSADILDFELEKDYYFDGKLLNRYGMSNELTFSTNMPDGIGTFVHEFSHVLGLPDLYATNYSGAFTPEGYSTLDYASYNNGGRTPANYSIFERYCLGWATPRTIPASGEYKLEAIHRSNDGFIIPTERPDEFFMLENRQQEGYDKYIPGHGMLVWHIDFDQSAWDNNIVNNNRQHQHVDIVEADNIKSSATRSGDTFPGRSGMTKFGFKTVPGLKSWNNKPLSVIQLASISETSEGLISFNADVDLSGVDHVESDARGIRSENGMISNHTDHEITIFDLSGRRMAQIYSAESANLPAGLYIARGEGISEKILHK